MAVLLASLCSYTCVYTAARALPKAHHGGSLARHYSLANDKLIDLLIALYQFEAPIYQLV